jgi:serine protease Do
MDGRNALRFWRAHKDALLTLAASDGRGVVVAVAEAANAAEMGMRVGDVVTEASQDPIKSVDDLVAKIEKAKAEKKKSILLLVYRAGDLRFVALKLE